MSSISEALPPSPSPTSTDPATPAPSADRRSPRAVDLSWVIGLFGTAVGAGILFLPINAGAGGLWPLLIVTISSVR